ncbi:ribulose-phosphate 3-epimerase [Natranaerobius thermophilus]|nr:ribulose-phosphate 3-epimerase [Natranaerobius thermophilus]
MTLVAPSILSADLLKLEEQIKAVEAAGADMIHVDVMDGRFVPNITMGPKIVEALKRITSIPCDVHLMIEEPEKYIDKFAQAGADILTIHQEASLHLDRNIEAITAHDIKAGVSLNPATPLEQIKWVLPKLDQVLLMSVNPGFGGQKYIPYVSGKISDLDKIRKAGKYSFMIQVDGGINHSNAKQVLDSGADILVAGSAIFSSKLGLEQAIKLLKYPSPDPTSI